MVRSWIFVVLFAVALGNVTAQNQEEYWDGDYDDTWWSNEADDNDLGIVASKENKYDSASIDEDYEVADAKTLDLNEDKLLDGEKIDNLDKSVDEDDNFEDSPSSDEKENAPDSAQNDKAVQEEIEQYQKDVDDPASFIADDELTADDTFDDEPLKGVNEETLDTLKNNEDENDDKFDDFEPIDDTPVGEDVVKNEASVEENLENSEDTKKEPKSDENTFDDYQVEDNRSVEIVALENNGDNEQSDPKLIEETKNILKESDDNFEVDPAEQVNEKETISSESKKEMENAVDKIEKENTELDEIDKYMREAAADLEHKKVENEAQDKGNDDNISEFDETDSNEDTVDKVYADLKSDLDKLFETWNKLNDDVSEEVNVEEYEKKTGKPYGEDVVLSQRNDYDENYDDYVAENIDSNLADIFKDKVDDVKKTGEKVENILPAAEKTDDSDNPDRQAYDNDGLVADEPTKKPEEENALNAESTTVKASNAEEVTSTVNDNLTSTVKTMAVEELSPEQYNDLMSQFVASHKDELDTHREDFGRSIAPIHLTLSTEKTTEITSPNWPSPYPTNNVVDWILEGNGNGIELNVTDLNIRGALGDYLLIKPGGADETGHEGLVFSFHLNEPRRYRFTDVDRVFVRFVSGAGWGFLPGFRMTVKLIWPLTDEELPEPEAVAPSLPGVYAVTLGGLSIYEFQDQKDEFRRLIADMALMYINANNIEMGVNTTSETTRIVGYGLCNINWPNYDSCVQVIFGVPLVHDDSPPTRLNDTDLRTMWETYVTRDPFATRLRAMGITEFATPNDGRILTLWTIMAVGVLISAALLAVSLWRYSCFENYTRMKTFSDTDSIRDEKRGLDLYPTPHQTLPPLYSDADYNWADAKYEDTARVDMGGIANTGYIRDELLNMDSDDEVVDPRDRYTTDV